MRLLLLAIALLIALSVSARWCAIAIERSKLRDAARSSEVGRVALTRCESAIARDDLATAIGSLNEAMVEYNEGRLVESLPRLQHCWDTVNEWCDARDAHVRRGSAFFDQAHLSAAIGEFKKALALDPAHLYARINLSFALSAQGDTTGAVREAEESVRLDANSADAHLALGCVHRRSFNFAKAIAEFQVSVRLAPERFEAWASLGAAFMETGKLDDAALALGKALELNPLHQQVRSHAAQIKRLRESQPRLPDVLALREVPKSPVAAADFATLCCLASPRHNESAVWLFELAFSTRRELADDLFLAHRYRAACAAALAASHAGANPNPEADRASFRHKALNWLKADLRVRHAQARSTKGHERLEAIDMLQYWLREPAFVPLRSGPGQMEMPPAEREVWNRLWDDVRVTIADAQKPQGKQ